MRPYTLLICLSLLVNLAACTNDPAPGDGGGMRQNRVDPSSAGRDRPPSSLFFPRLLPSVPPARGAPVIPSPSVDKDQGGLPATAVESSPVAKFRLCSPLVDTPLEQLSTIITDPYRPPPAGSEARHHGVDFAYYRKFDRASIEGAGIQSVLKGAVAAVIADRFPYGNMVIIETPALLLPSKVAALIQMGEGEALYVLYAHMERPAALRLGDNVEACQPLGNVGRSGNAGGAHLHLEMRLGPGGARFAGMAYYLPWASQEERENYVLWRTSGVFRHFDPMLVLGTY